MQAHHLVYWCIECNVSPRICQSCAHDKDDSLRYKDKRNKATGPAAALSSATGQAARTERESASAHAAQALAAHAGTVPVVAIGNAIVQCAKAVRDAGLLGVEESGDAGELPKWNEVPKE